jgi:hypothetical protein
MRTYFFTCGILALLCCAAPGFGSTASICDGVSGNLVLNCGFETGDFSDWNVLNDDGNTLVEGSSFPDGVNSGNFFAALGDEAATPTTVGQTFSDIAGTILTFSFYLYSDGEPDGFAAQWDGETLLSLPDAPQQAYTLYSYTVTGTGSDTISFSLQDAPGFDGLDDVVVVDPPPSPTPEPSSPVFAVAALALIVLAHRRLTKKTT